MKLLQLRLKAGSIESPVLKVASERDFGAPDHCLASDGERGTCGRAGRTGHCNPWRSARRRSHRTGRWTSPGMPHSRHVPRSRHLDYCQWLRRMHHGRLETRSHEPWCQRRGLESGSWRHKTHRQHPSSATWRFPMALPWHRMAPSSSPRLGGTALSWRAPTRLHRLASCWQICRPIPARIVPADDGYWLALFAPRNQLVEFVLKEDDYRRRMTADRSGLLDCTLPGQRRELSRADPGRHPQETQHAQALGAELVLWLGRPLRQSMRPLESFHSRADGNVHGVTSLCKMGSFMVRRQGLRRNCGGGSKMTAILELKQATKEFRGVPAIKDVDFTSSGGKSTPSSVRMVRANRRS